MKTSLLFRLGLVLFVLLFAPRAQAQTAPAPAQPGYWNVETNLTTRDYSVVRFYNGQDQLVYEERLDNFCLDLARRSRPCRRATRRLNAALAQVLQDPTARPNPGLLARQFGPDRRLQRVYAAR